MRELKKCKCGNKFPYIIEQYSNGSRRFGVICLNCESQTNYEPTRERAINAWNTRQQETEVSEE